MKARIRDGDLILTANDSLDARALRILYKRGHLHLVCKAIQDRPKARYGPALVLCPSVIRWQPSNRADRARG